MSVNFKELDYQQTPMGELVLRRRRDPLLNTDVYEVKLNEEFLMSSLFTKAEEELARFCLANRPEKNLDVLVGGLGLGYTAHAALEFNNVRNITIMEVLPEVIKWHKQGLVPLGNQLCGDTRCQLVHDDFFRFIRCCDEEKQPGIPASLYHAILLDIDHSPRMFLHPDHGSFYQDTGLKQLAAHLHNGGIFGMWSNDPPDEDFLEILAKIFTRAETKNVRFPNPYQDKDATATIYMARKGE